ncbi:hypothetical protein GR212_32905 [Rhizobium lusitanum]|uniref:Uncharacterized protein n=1 Tax=Rhizobium lusitanum TaxID=293958 RepID=A0A6L9UIF4_9HYPH|nr:hypothetical protein [Rhizobium lusitanum]NEI74358.1 hypothetical protein [Rhizobium lusitanum]
MRIIALLVSISALFCVGCDRSDQSPDVHIVGFFTPRGTPPELVRRVDFAIVNAADPNQVESSLKTATGTSFKVSFNFTGIATDRKPSNAISMQYQDRTGSKHTKHFDPILPAPKLKQFPDDATIRKRLSPYFDLLAKYSENAGTIYLADEPYLNGLAKSEMERAGAVARQELDKRGLQSVKLGVIFSGGMFDRRYAYEMDKESGEYAKKWDWWYEHGNAVLRGLETDPTVDPSAFKQWVTHFSRVRLTTYDLAGNMYIEGGIPEGYDVVGYDLYLGTVLLDATYENSLSWFASNFPNTGCAQFAGQKMSQIRAKLSFFQDGPPLVGQKYIESDRKLLDSIFECRMKATTTMLRRTLAGRKADILLISGSSANDVREYDSAGNPEKQQPEEIIEQRVLDEVKRALAYYREEDFAAGVAFLPYEHEYDDSIDLWIGGVSDMPSVMAEIYKITLP